MFSLFNKNQSKSIIDDVSRSKYYLDKELHLEELFTRKIS